MSTRDDLDLSLLRATPRTTPLDAPWEAPPGERLNVASWLAARGRERPYQRALVVSDGRDALGRKRYAQLTTVQLDALCDAYAHGLTAQGIKRGDRVLMLVSQGFELIALTFALFKMGAVPVMIDPGMGLKPFLTCVSESTPSAVIGIPRGHAVRRLFGSAFKSVERAFTTRKAFWAGAQELEAIADFGAGEFRCVDTAAEELAAILFTSGSTGIAKGVHYTHGIFDAQVRAIGSMYGIAPGEIEVPAFPLFSLFSVALGMTCVIPEMDPSKPAEVDPREIVAPILDHGATTAFGSPAVWERVATYCQEQAITLPTLKRILTAGAPINTALLERYRDILAPGVAIHTPYGATECLPVSTISSTEVLEQTAQKTREGAGLCVGRPVDGMRVAIIGIRDEAIASWEEAEQLETGHIGEICVSGVVTTRAYDRKEEKTREAKIPDPARGEGAFWHRMGDVGYLDEQGRLWYCGRKAHRVETASGPLYSIQVEAIFNVHPRVSRSALVGVGARGQERPVLLVEPRDAAHPPTLEELREVAKGSPLTSQIEEIRILARPKMFPVDRRHNAKIHREQLAEEVAAGKWR